MAKYPKLPDNGFVLLLTEEEIGKRVRQLGRQIDKDYRGRVPIIIGILNGSFVFLADLVRRLTIDCEIDFLRISSYGRSKVSSGKVNLVNDLCCDVKGRDVIIVEDVIDSGSSVKFIRKKLAAHKPGTVRVVSLLRKKGTSQRRIPVEYVGFDIARHFVVGYGLDSAERFRNLRAIYRSTEDLVN